MARTVFLSSTFSDFVIERSILLETIPYVDIHVNCAERKGKTKPDIASSIKEWIDHSDMVVLLISEKYGTEPDALHSWTQKEFEYAASKNKEIYAYIRELPEEMKDYIDVDKVKEEKLAKFIKLVENYVGLVPRFKHGENHKLVAMVIRDIERWQRKFAKDENDERRDSYFDGFVE